MISQCSIQLLEAALAGILSADDEAALQRHLEECEGCGAALEQMAGGAALCQEAAFLLAEDDLDTTVPLHGDWSEVDFTVEHLEPSLTPNSLGKLGDYEVLEVIGRGGMGVVLKAFDRELKRCVAIKVLAPHLAHSSLAKKRFAREAQAAAAIVHPNVLAIHHVHPNGKLPFLVMPLVAGESLAERLATRGTLDLKEVLRIAMQAAAGLGAAHDQGLVHRDVKPANILLEKGVERVVLTDFGLARAADDVSMTRRGIIAGTPQYMSPEQAKGESLDGRSDLFSLGCVMYEMATGVSPFRTDSAMATMRRLVDDAPPAMASLNPELPPWFIAIVNRLLAKEPAQRFASAKEVTEILEDCLAHIQHPTSRPLPAALSKPFPQPTSGRRNTRFQGVLVMFCVLGIILLGVFGWQASKPPDPAGLSQKSESRGTSEASVAPDLAGSWRGTEWGNIVLKKVSDTQYTGGYIDRFGKHPGKIELRWSQTHGWFNGTWTEGENRSGGLLLSLVDTNEIRGLSTTDREPKNETGKARLTDVVWERAEKDTPEKSSTKSGATADKPAPAEATRLKVTVVFVRSNAADLLQGEKSLDGKILLTRFLQEAFIADATEREGNRETAVSLDRDLVDSRLDRLRALGVIAMSDSVTVQPATDEFTKVRLVQTFLNPKTKLAPATWGFRANTTKKAGERIQLARNYAADNQAGTSFLVDPNRAAIIPWHFNTSGSRDLREDFSNEYDGETFLIINPAAGKQPAPILYLGAEQKPSALQDHDLETLKKTPRNEEGFTVWGKEVGGLRAGLGLPAGEKRVYHHGDTVRLVVWIRNVSQEDVKVHILFPFFERQLAVTNDEGQAIPQEKVNKGLGEHNSGEITLAPGKEIQLHELKRELSPTSERGKRDFSKLYGTGKVSVQYEVRFELDPKLVKLATGKLELEINPAPRGDNGK